LTSVQEEIFFEKLEEKEKNLTEKRVQGTNNRNIEEAFS
jgi:hypothetical protein